MSKPSNQRACALVVDDDSSLRRAVTAALEGHVSELRSCGDLHSARAILETWEPSILLLDVSLPDGSAFDLLDQLRRRVPTPAIVAMSGVATPNDSFRLAQLGVRCFLTKPFQAKDVQRAVADALLGEVDIEPHLRAAVGRLPMQQVQNQVRTVMVGEAMARAGGNRRGAARLLHISRQLLQYMLKRIDGD